MYSDVSRPVTRPTATVYGTSSAGGVRLLGAGIAAGLVLLLLGLIASSGPITKLDTAVDGGVAALRAGPFTLLAKAATAVAWPTGGAILAVLVPVVLFLLRRRGTALRVLCVMIVPLGIAFVVKHLVSEPRPPHKLWLMPPDSPESFPSGHTTVACAYAVAALIIVPLAARRLTAILGVVFVLLVAWSRVYVGVHYPLDVLGGMLTTGCAVLVLAGLAKLPPARRWLTILDGQSRGPGQSRGR